MAGLMDLTSTDLQAALTQLDGALNFPERDGVVLTSGDIYEAFVANSGSFDLFIGTAADEARYFIAAAGSLEAFAQYITLAYEQVAEGLNAVPVYGEQLLGAAENFIALQGDTDTVWAYSEFFNDLLFRGPAVTMAQAHAGNTYMYYWNIPSVIPGFGACHASEIPLSEQRELITPLLSAGISGREIINALDAGLTPNEDVTPPDYNTQSEDITPVTPHDGETLTSIGSSGGGCNAGMMPLFMMLVIPVIARKKK